jgi:carbamoyltransferase
MPLRILGISAFYHDSAAAIVEDGVIIAAAQEERFTRKKQDAGFPEHAIKYCLQQSGATLRDIDQVVFYDKPFIKFERLIETYLSFAPKGFVSFSKAMPVWLSEKLFQRSLLNRNLKSIDPDFDPARLLFTEHHVAHAASAFFPSPFEQALVLSIDGVGEWCTTSVAIGKGNELNIQREIHFPHSLGLLYSAFTYYTGFKVNSGEYKIMGLAPYGEPKYVNLIRDNLIDVKPDGSYRLNMDYFDYCTGLTMTNAKFDELFGGPPRKPEQLLTQREMDLTASIQAVLEDVLITMTRSLAKEFNQENLCLSGGVALNCVANGKILRDGAFKNVWIQPASGDAGGAVGAALMAYHGFHGKSRNPVTTPDGMSGSYLGPEFAQSDIEKRLRTVGAVFSTLEEKQVVDQAATDIAAGKAIGWMQGRMEFGPRALGNRSILGDARSKTMQSLLNLKVKYRESFRPFAPSVLRESVSEWFDLETDSPYMLLVADVKQAHRKEMTKAEHALFGIEKLNVPRSTIPAVTHVDYSARVQTVHKETNPKYHALISAFHKRTGCPVIVNTSFNVRGEPLICTPEDAFKCFMGTEIEVLVVGNCYLRKEDQDPKLKLNYETAFDLD